MMNMIIGISIIGICVLSGITWLAAWLLILREELARKIIVLDKED